jgi:hypothetical protein
MGDTIFSGTISGNKGVVMGAMKDATKITGSTTVQPSHFFDYIGCSKHHG